MKNHIWRPLYIALAILFLGIAARFIIVPPDFGVHEAGYMYGWHRKANENEWASLPIKYRTAKICIDCHRDKYVDIKDSPHKAISCENCHGANYDHPKNPVSLETNRSRGLCLRCHTKLPYKGTLRGIMKGINPESHYPQAECVMCHYPHNPKRSQEVKR